MPAKLVPTVRTTYTTAQVVKAFIEGWKKLYKETPKKESIGVIYAQNALETGLTKAMWNNNIGNVKYVANAKDTEEIEYCMLANVWEIINGKKVTFQPPSPVTWFRSFKTVADGVEHHFKFLKNNRYKIAWEAVEKGDPALFSKLLKKQGYYTAAEADYTKLMNYHFKQFMGAKYYEDAVKALVIAPVPPKEEPKPPPVPVTPPPVPEPELIEVPAGDSIGDHKQVEISTWQKVEVEIYEFLGKMPWIQLVEYLTAPKSNPPKN